MGCDCSDEDPIYDMEGYLRMFPLQQSYDVPNNFDVWQQDDDIITEFFQAPMDDLVQCSLDDFRSYLEDFDDYSSEHLDLFHEEDYQPPLCSDLGSKSNVCRKKDSCDTFLQPPLITLPFYVIKGVVGKYVLCIEFPLRQTLEFKGRLNTSRKGTSF